MKMNKSNENNKGFTLIELLVVIAIIGVLTSVVLALVQSARKKADAVYVKYEADQMKKEFELYYQAHGNYGVFNTNQYSSYFPPTESSPGGPANCFYPLTSYSAEKVFFIAGKAMEHTNPIPGQPRWVWCVVTPNGQAYVFAFEGMKSGYKTYCFDSSGNIKESNIGYPSYPIDATTATCL